MSDWQPMETAPRDGRLFWCFSPLSGLPVLTRWSHVNARFDSFPVEAIVGRHEGTEAVDWWQPIQEPPEPKP